MFERIVGKCPPDFFSQPTKSSIVNINTKVNTRQREMLNLKAPSPLVEQSIKKGKDLNHK